MKIVKITNDNGIIGNKWYKNGEYHIVNDVRYIPYVGSTVTVFTSAEHIDKFILCEDCEVLRSNIEYFDVALNCIETLKKLDMVNKAKEWKPVNGEMIEVRDHESCYWQARKFIGMDGEKFVCKGILRYGYSDWTYARKIEEPKETIMNIKEIEEKLGIKNLKIVKE